MTSVADLNTKAQKTGTNMDRFDRFVNGGVDELVGVDDGSIRTIRGIQQYGNPGPKGDPGGSDNSYTTLAAFKASPTSRLTASLIGVPNVADGRVNWTLGNYTGLADDKTIFEADSTSLATGAWVRQLAERAYLRNFGADVTGATDVTAALALAFASAKRVIGAPGDVYLLSNDNPVIVPAGREFIGNGGTLKIGANKIGLRLDNNLCLVSGWTIQGNGGLYGVLNTGIFNAFSNNICTGNIGHFFFSSGAQFARAFGNTVDGMTADSEITTAIVFENCKHVSATRNQFRNIPKGWSIQVRGGSENFVIEQNNFLQTQWSDTKTATANQKVFNFDIGSVCLLKAIQINGLPVSKSYTITGSGPAYTVTFTNGRAANEIVKLIGYRGAENVQVNTDAKHGIISGNTIDGTGDSGLVLYGSHLLVTKNQIRNCGYAGIAGYGGQDHIVVSHNLIKDCAQMDDAQSSPDDPAQSSVFAGAILVSGQNFKVVDNEIINDSGTMRYAIRINTTDMTLRTDGTFAIRLRGNTYSGSYFDGQVVAPNQTTGKRVNSVDCDGPSVFYPEQINLDAAYVERAPTPSGFFDPASTTYFTVGGSSQTRAVRDTAIKRGGLASLQTVAGQYVDFTLNGAAVFRDCVVYVTFWAKNAGGSSYFHAITSLGGLEVALPVEIMSTDWKQYTISFTLTDQLADTIKLRIGGNSGSANVQYINVSGRRLI